MTNMSKTLYRIPKQGQISGVCAGLAEYFDFDVTLIRLMFVVVTFISGGSMIIAYIIVSIILPVDQGEVGGTISEKASRLGRDLSSAKTVERMRNYLGVGLVIFGSWLLLRKFMPIWFDIRWDYVWPVALIIIGILVIIKRKK